MLSRLILIAAIILPLPAYADWHGHGGGWHGGGWHARPRFFFGFGAPVYRPYPYSYPYPYRYYPQQHYPYYYPGY